MLSFLQRWYVVTLVLLGSIVLVFMLWPTQHVPPAEGVAEPEFAEEPAGFQTGEVGFTVTVKDVVNPYEVFGIFVMPGEEIELRAAFTDAASVMDLEVAGGEAERVDPAEWQWTAPEDPGLYELVVTDERIEDAQMTINAFVMEPYDHMGSINGYRIGTYERTPLRGNPVYNRPDGFARITPENRDTRVSPHFTIGQFLAKQESDWPKYLILREQLVIKLEMILQEINDLGLEAHTLHVMSGFRTPWYNRSIGNETSYSRHLFGGAADIFVDRNEDTYMDDLNGDGEVTVADAHVMTRIVESKTDEVWYRPLAGGLGTYAPAPHRGPFIHVDVRGEPARW